MNKHRRHELKMLKYKKRLSQIGLRPNELKTNFTSYRSHGKPCSCNLCRNEKYRNTYRKRMKLVKIDDLIIKTE